MSFLALMTMGSPALARKCSKQVSVPPHPATAATANCYVPNTTVNMVDAFLTFQSNVWDIEVYLYDPPGGATGMLSATAFTFKSNGDELPCGVWPPQQGIGYRNPPGQCAASPRPATLTVYGTD